VVEGNEGVIKEGLFLGNLTFVGHDTLLSLFGENQV